MDTQRTCYNGPKCTYLANGNCRFYHPSWHLQQSNEERIRRFSSLNKYQQRNSQYARNQMNVPQGYSIFDGSYNGDNGFFSSIERHRQGRRMSSRERERQREQEERIEEVQRQRQTIRQSAIVPRMYIFMGPTFVFGQNPQSLSINQRLPNPFNMQPNQNLAIEFNEEFDWFFDKNKTINPQNLTEEERKTHGKCTICFEGFDCSENETNLIEHKEEIEKGKQLQQMKEKGGKTIEQNSIDDHFIIQLSCGHVFHKKCIKEWFRRSLTCANCRRDFHRHESYSEYDQQYMSRVMRCLPSRSRMPLTRPREIPQMDSHMQIERHQMHLNHRDLEEDMSDVQVKE